VSTCVLLTMDMLRDALDRSRAACER